ncbi:MAG: DUF6438 domain-containing protein [Saprospiraceae bacterium]|nr:DUF6438 domain-containing protein [Saprospiraceae bacterium]
MYNLLYIFGLTALLAACSPKVTPTTQQQESAPTEKEETDQKSESIPTLMVSFRKTACYGDCPAYEARFMSDGAVRYHGIRNVEKEGYFRAENQQQTLQKIIEKAEAIRFFDLAEKYPFENPMIVDLPNTFTYIKKGNQEHQIQNNHDAPATLLELEQLIEHQLSQMEWTTDAPWKKD